MRRKCTGAKHGTEDADAFLLRKKCVVGEHSLCSEAGPARAGGAQGRENVGMSNHNPNEKLEPRKSKVSVALAINHGLGGPKAIPKGAVDGKLVNIPALLCDYSSCAKEISVCGLLVFTFLARSSSERREKAGNLPCRHIRRAFREKHDAHVTEDPYRKPTQVDWASSPRGTSDSSLRNSAKKRP